MKPSERYMYHRLAEDLVTPARYALQDTVEFDSREVIDAVWDADIEAEKARILAERAYATEQPEPPDVAA